MYTQTDLQNIEQAIRDIIDGKRTVSLSMGDKAITYTKTDLAELRQLRNEIAFEVGCQARRYSPRVYAAQGRRG